MTEHEETAKEIMSAHGINFGGEHKEWGDAIAKAIAAAIDEAARTERDLGLDKEKSLIAMIQKQDQRIRVLEEINANLATAVRKSPIPWVHDQRGSQ